MYALIAYLITSNIFLALQSAENNTCAYTIETSQWCGIELTFTSSENYKNAYTDVEMWAWFVNDKGDSLKRPAFWDGGNTWKVRFTAPDAKHRWKWYTYALPALNGLSNKSGEIAPLATTNKNTFNRHGLLKMSPGKRNVIYADGTPFLLVGDTPWSLPYRATTGQAEEYAADRQQKGFNAALLLAVQPDKLAEGPPARNTNEGFARAFADLPAGHLNNLEPLYFKTLDSFINILNYHQIVPVFAPLAFGYGWKGKEALGQNAVPAEYARFCRYLVARYGSSPACWLISLDGNGKAPCVTAAGKEIETWDAYQQPVGLHYSPCDDFLASWAGNDSSYCFHYDSTHQSAVWLDFQWAQTGHEDKHIYHKVERMYGYTPVKAVMNGEPTYEKMEEGKYGLGWWQGEDAWNQLMHGGTMGVVYGAACLWQWKITADEPGWESWTNANYSWKDALHFEGSNYVGAIAKAFKGFDFTDMQKRWDLTEKNNPLLAKEGVFYIAYLESGGTISIKKVSQHLPYHWFNPRTGTFHEANKKIETNSFKAPNNSQPWVLIIGNKKEE